MRDTTDVFYDRLRGKVKGFVEGGVYEPEI